MLGYDAGTRRHLVVYTADEMQCEELLSGPSQPELSTSVWRPCIKTTQRGAAAKAASNAAAKAAAGLGEEEDEGEAAAGGAEGEAARRGREGGAGGGGGGEGGEGGDESAVAVPRMSPADRLAAVATLGALEAAVKAARSEERPAEKEDVPEAEGWTIRWKARVRKGAGGVAGDVYLYTPTGKTIDSIRKAERWLGLGAR